MSYLLKQAGVSSKRISIHVSLVPFPHPETQQEQRRDHLGLPEAHVTGLGEENASASLPPALSCPVGIVFKITPARPTNFNADAERVHKYSIAPLRFAVFIAAISSDVIPATGCVFRLMPVTDSGACRSPIPADAGHLFRGMPVGV